MVTVLMEAGASFHTSQIILNEMTEPLLDDPFEAPTRRAAELKAEVAGVVLKMALSTTIGKTTLGVAPAVST